MGVVLNQSSANAVLPGYRPVAVRVELQTTEANVERVEVDVEWAGSSIVIMRLVWWRKTDLGGGTFRYDFDVDVQRLAQGRLIPLRSAKSKVVGALGAEYLEAVDNGAGSMQLHFTFLFRDTDNLLKTLPAESASSNTWYIIPFAQRQEEQYGIEGAGKWVNTGGMDVVKWLSRIPNTGNEVSLDENGWLSFYALNINAYRVRAYNAAGVIQWTKIKGLGAEANTNQVVTVGAGPVNIDAVSVWDYIDSVNGPTLANKAYYIIDFGDHAGAGTFNSFSNQIRFDIVSREESKRFRLHWLNAEGGGDGYSFSCVRVRQKKVNSNKAAKSLRWGMTATDFTASTQHSKSDFGRFRTNIRSGTVYEVESKKEDSEHLRWLEGVIDSPEVYWEDVDTGALLRCNVEDVSGVVVDDSRDGTGNVLSLKIELANDQIRQRY